MTYPDGEYLVTLPDSGQVREAQVVTTPGARWLKYGCAVWELTMAIQCGFTLRPQGQEES